MNFEKLSEIIKEAGINICPICGTPYKEYNANQKTCATPECKREWKNRYLREHREKLMKENPEAFRQYRREAQKKSRNKARGLREADSQYEKLQTYWEKRENVATGLSDGKEYATRQVESTLASVPKIDVEGFLKGISDGKLQQTDRQTDGAGEDAGEQSEGDQQGYGNDEGEDAPYKP